MARLPQVGGDADTWGQVLNDFLSTAHAADGTLKPGTVDTSQLANGAITTNQLDSGAVDVSKLATSGAPTSGQTLTYDGTGLTWTTPSGSGSVPDATSSTKGLIQLSGDLAGTAAAPTVPGLANKEPTVTAGTTSQYYRGDKSWQALDKTAVGLANVDDTSDANKPISTATQTALNTKATTASLATVATSGSYTDLTNTPTIPAAQVNADWNAGSGVAQILNKPAIPTVTDATTGAKGIVQLAGDLAGTATVPTVPGLAAKAPLASPALTGTPTAPTATAGTNTTQIASTAFVATAISSAAVPAATTSVAGKVQLADATDVANASGTDALTAGLIPATQGVTGIAKVQFIPNGGTVTGSPGPYTIIIEAGA